MGRPRTPIVRAAKTADALRRDQEDVVEAVACAFEELGLTENQVETLVRAFEEHGAGEALVRRIEEEFSVRRERIRLLLTREVEAHAELHRLWGSPQMLVDARPRHPRSGAHRKRADTMVDETPCGLGEACEAFAREVRMHARFCAWLREEVEWDQGLPAKERENLRTRARRELEEFAPHLMSKKDIARFVRQLAEVSPRDFAIFLLARTGGELPLKELTIRTKAHAISQAMSEAKKHQDGRRRSAKS